MSVKGIPEVPFTGTTALYANDWPRRQFQRFMMDNINVVSANAAAYLNKRVRNSAVYGGDAGLHRVLNGVTFIPAHQSRWRPGFDLAKVKYFVVHRPGNYPRACTYANTIREFSIYHRPAATHFVISKTGAITQMVDLQDTAFHCGRSPGLRNGNSVSIGAELEGAVGEPFTVAQYEALAELLNVLTGVTGLVLDAKPRRVLGHSEIAPKRKTDPGYNFSYNRVISMAMSLPPPSSNPYRATVGSVGDVVAGIFAEFGAGPRMAAGEASNSVFAAMANGMSRAINMSYVNRMDLMVGGNTDMMELNAGLEQAMNRAMTLDNQLIALEALDIDLVLPKGIGFDFEPVVGGEEEGTS